MRSNKDASACQKIMVNEWKNKLPENPNRPLRFRHLERRNRHKIAINGSIYVCRKVWEP